MSFEYKKILNLHAKYIDYLLEKTHLSHQGVHNIDFCGSEVESEIRSFMQNLIPERFKVTHGYILYAPDNESEPRVSPQVDLMLVDTLVTHNIFTLDKKNGMEIVPVEAVVGVFEIKRTLNRRSFQDASEQLEEIINAVSISKSDEKHYLPGGIPLDKNMVSGIYSNPLVGIISLDHEHDYFKKNSKEIFEHSMELKVDIIASFSGMLICPVDHERKGVLIYNAPDNPDKNREYGNFNSSANGGNQAAILSRLIGYICAYLSMCTGRRIKVENYFFNKPTLGIIN